MDEIEYSACVPMLYAVEDGSVLEIELEDRTGEVVGREVYRAADDGRPSAAYCAVQDFLCMLAQDDYPWESWEGRMDPEPKDAGRFYEIADGRRYCGEFSPALFSAFPPFLTPDLFDDEGSSFDEACPRFAPVNDRLVWGQDESGSNSLTYYFGETACQASFASTREAAEAWRCLMCHTDIATGSVAQLIDKVFGNSRIVPASDVFGPSRVIADTELYDPDGDPMCLAREGGELNAIHALDELPYPLSAYFAL